MPEKRCKACGRALVFAKSQETGNAAPKTTQLSEARKRLTPAQRKIVKAVMKQTELELAFERLASLTNSTCTSATMASSSSACRTTGRTTTAPSPAQRRSKAATMTERETPSAYPLAWPVEREALEAKASFLEEVFAASEERVRELEGALREHLDDYPKISHEAPSWTRLRAALAGRKEE